MVDRPRLEVTSREQWRAWLEANAGTSDGVWLVTYKRGRGPYLPYAEVVREAIAFGWVDSLPRTLDDDRTMRQLTPRRPGSSWSAVNKAHVESLAREGLMTPAGWAAVERAKADGSWERLDDVESLSEPTDLSAALDAHPQARAHWDAFPRSAKRAVLEWIGTAKTDATRAKRIRQTVDEAAVGRRANQWRQPGSPSMRTRGRGGAPD